MPIRKLCAFAGCNVLIDKGERYCQKHKEKAERESVLKAEGKADDPKWYEKLERKNEQYQTSRWRTESASFLRQHHTCYYCGERATEVHHGIPPRGEDELFWDRSNWVPVCHDCHQRMTLEEMRERREQKRQEREKNVRIKRLWY